MVAVNAGVLPDDGRWAYEPKFDGFRCLAYSRGGDVALQSRQMRPLGSYFPEVVDAVGCLGTDVVLDGELVVWRQGRLDFAALQARIHPARKRALVLAESLPAAYIVFDVLARKKTDLRLLSYLQRRDVLEDLLGTRLPDGLVLMPMSEGIDVARSWMLSHSAAGIEGVVAKRVDQTYRAGARRWRKVRTRITAEAVVGGVLGPLDAPDALILGRPDDRGRLRVAGRTSVLRPACVGSWR